ncbi:hypothetical protein H0W80_00180 [Candidatus Saccharibacteria bacterium]|nr:hypothetical protein [Candidatus Saccharibacteria bacterium]
MNYVIITILALSVILSLSKFDDQALVGNMVTTCEQNYAEVHQEDTTLHNVTLENECGQLIDQVQSKGYEVLQKDGRFWAEYKGETK